MANRAKKYQCDLARLTSAMRRCRLTLRRFRAERREMVRQFVGNHWSDEGTAEKVPVNLISLYVQVMTRQLVAKDPRGLFTTFDRNNKAVVEAEQDWVNKQVVRMRLANTLRRVVIDALFSIGICKVALSTPANAAAVSWSLPAGQPFAERVDLDDFVFDVHARDFSEVSFVGHRYRVPLDAVRDSTLYNPARKKLTPSGDAAFNEEGDERISVLGKSYYQSGAEEFEEHVDLWEIYLPRRRVVLTLADPIGSDEFEEPLREQEWLGPDEGPIHVLGYQWVPGQAMPKGPIMDLMDLHTFVNQTYRKLMRQADRQKTCTFVRGGGSEDGARVQSANDGDIPRVDNPEQIKEVAMGGPQQGNFLFAQHAWQLFSKQAGNLEMMAGLAPQSKTASQDKMLMGSASGQVASMQQDTAEFIESVFRSLSWYFHHHPTLEMKQRFALPGLPEYQTVRRVTPGQRSQVPFSELDVSIDVYSMQQQTPQTRLASINQAVQMFQPFAQLAQAQGITLDLNRLFDLVGRYMDLPELAEVLTLQRPPAVEGGSGGGQGSQPAETTRNYVRRSLGEDSQQSGEMELANQLAKGMGTEGQNTLNPAGAA